jgi:hypothetical protein
LLFLPNTLPVSSFFLLTPFRASSDHMRSVLECFSVLCR